MFDTTMKDSVTTKVHINDTYEVIVVAPPKQDTHDNQTEHNQTASNNTEPKVVNN